MLEHQWWKDASDHLPLTPQQTIYQTVTAVSLNIFAVSDTSFKSKAKFLSNTLTLDIVAKADQFNLVKTQIFNPRSIKARTASGT